MKKTLLLLVLSGIFLLNSCDAMFEKYTVEFKSDKDKSNLPGAYEVRKGTIITEDDLPVLEDLVYEIEKWHVNYVINNVRKSEDFKGSLEVNSDVIFTAVWKEKKLTEEEKEYLDIKSSDICLKIRNNYSMNNYNDCHTIFYNIREDTQFWFNYPSKYNEKVYKLPEVNIKIYITEWEYDLEKEKWVNKEEDDVFLKEVKLDEKFDSLYREEYFSKFKKPDSNIVYNTFSYEITVKENDIIKETEKYKTTGRFIYIDNGSREGACEEELKIERETNEYDLFDKLKDYLIYDNIDTHFIIDTLE